MRRSKVDKIRNLISANWRLYILLLPAIIWLVVFCYTPMYGAIIAFKDFNPKLGILDSPWAGLKWFELFFRTSNAVKTIRNTFLISLYSIIFTFPVPVLFAILLNQVGSKNYKKLVQTVSFAPHFISTVVIVSMLNLMLSPTSGILNNLLTLITGETRLYLLRPEYFRPVYIISGVWQGMGFGSIIYIAALAGISPELHEAAIVDGATRLQRIRYIDLPGIAPTMVIQFILSMGSILSVGYEKAYLMQNTMNTSVSELISTYVYKIGLQNARYSLSTAVGLFNSVVNLVMLVVANSVMKRISHTSLF